MINASWSCFFLRDFLSKFADESMDLGGPVLFLSCALYFYVFEYCPQLATPVVVKIIS